MADALRRGIDPKAEAIGEHGSLIGGNGKPPTRFDGGRRAEDMVRMPPMPLPLGSTTKMPTFAPSAPTRMNT